MSNAVERSEVSLEPASWFARAKGSMSRFQRDEVGATSTIEKLLILFVAAVIIIILLAYGKDVFNKVKQKICEILGC
jgi:Flp pilus assembly pilin Flp